MINLFKLLGCDDLHMIMKPNEENVQTHTFTEVLTASKADSLFRLPMTAVRQVPRGPRAVTWQELQPGETLERVCLETQ